MRCLHAAGELDLTPYRDALLARLGEQGLAGPPSRGGDHQVDVTVLRQCTRLGLPQAHLDTEHLEHLGTLVILWRVRAVDDEHPGAALHGLVSHRIAGDTEPSHEDPQPGHVETGPGQLLDIDGAGALRHELSLGRASR